MLRLIFVRPVHEQRTFRCLQGLGRGGDGGGGVESGWGGVGWGGGGEVGGFRGVWAGLGGGGGWAANFKGVADSLVTVLRINRFAQATCSLPSALASWARAAWVNLWKLDRSHRLELLRRTQILRCSCGRAGPIKHKRVKQTNPGGKRRTPPWRCLSWDFRPVNYRYLDSQVAVFFSHCCWFLG